MCVVAPSGARAKVEEIVPVDATEVDFGDPAVRFLTVPGTGNREAALVVETKSGTTLIVSDLIFNLANRPGPSGWLFKTIGMTADLPHIPPLIRMRRVDDKDAVQAELQRWSRLPNLNRVIVSHGSIIAAEYLAALLTSSRPKRGVRLSSESVDRSMARKHLALAASAPPPSRNRRSRRAKRNAPGAPAHPNGAEWSDLEQAFFSSAPPEDPDPAAESECFDDLLAPRPPRWEGFGALRRAMAAACAALPRLVFGLARRSRRASPL
jgi:hypothetical protein